MKKIGLLSDTHGYIDPKIFEFMKDVDEIWHAGDIGNFETIERLAQFKPVRAVYGNIDGHELRAQFKKHLKFSCEGVRVWMTHIGGYPGHYDKYVREGMKYGAPDLFISGHSHILKVMNDKKYALLHMNPGAIGNHGFHQFKTMIRFQIHEGRVQELEVMELPRQTSMVSE